MFLVVDNVGCIIHCFDDDYPEAAVLAFLRTQADHTLGHRHAGDPPDYRRSIGGIMPPEVQHG
jgi:hypothetical protein